MILYSFNGWIQIFQEPVFRQISREQGFGKPKLITHDSYSQFIF